MFLLIASIHFFFNFSSFGNTWPPLLEQVGTKQQVDGIVYNSSMLSGELLINRKSV
jgi:hypothetical protein